ncbi:MAG: 30S ribosomal protein S4 [Candidatus Thermoplasmatota archaeon]|nr:30S ribosomal protein S4 [Candidatus Thermoplasmatota archaeon]
MGDPRKLKKKYQTPSHPWQGERIKEEKELLMKYGLKNKKEVWKAQSFLRNLREQARTLQAQIRTENVQAIKEGDLLLKKCSRLGFLEEGASLVDVLSIQIDTLLSRRLQTLVYTKGLAGTPKQARQMITHGHIILKDRRVTIPGMIVPRINERFIEYDQKSPFAFEEHPMRPKTETAASPFEATSQVPDKISINVPGGDGK